MQVDVKYEFLNQQQMLSKIEALDKKFAHLDATLSKSDKKINTFGKGANFANLIPAGGKLEKSLSMLNDIPNLNTGILSSAMGIANPYVLAGSAVVAFGALAVKSTNMALDWNEGMSKANTTIGETPEGLARISEKLQKMNRYGTDMATIPLSFEKIISGVGDSNKALDIMSVSLKSARANFADLDVTGDAIVNIMGSAGKQFKNASEISDLLTETKILGKAEFNDMANYLPRIIPYANQLGFEVKEVAGAMALLTSTGQSTEQTSMLLQNTFVALADGKKRSNIEKFVKVFDKGNIRPFADIMVDIKNKMEHLSKQGKVEFFNALDLDAQAASGFQQMIDNTDLLKSNIEKLGKSAGATNKALLDGKNASDGVSRIKEKWENLQMKLGQKIAPWWDKIVTGLADTFDWLEKVEQKTGLFSKAWSVAGNVIKWFSIPLNQLWNIGKFVFGMLKDGADFLATKFPNAFSYAGTVIKDVTAYFRDLFFVVSETFDMLTNIVTLDWGKLGGNIDNFKDHKYMDMSTPTPVLSQDESMAVYNKAIAGGVSKTKLDAMAKKWGIAIPQAPTNKTTKTDDSILPPCTDDKKTKAHANKVERDLNSISGGGTQIRNVIVNIGKQIEKVEISTTNMQGMDVNKIKRILEDLLVASVRDAEIALAH